MSTTPAPAGRPEATPVPSEDRTVTVWEDGMQLDFTFADCMRYNF